MNEERGLVKYEARDGQQVTLSFDTIKRYLVQGHAEMVTQQELMFFMGTCKSRGLNPFNKDCYLIKYSAKQGAAIITAVDYFRKRAKAQRDCRGWQKGIIVERKGEVVYSKGLMLDDDILLGGWFKAQPEGWTEPFELEVNLKGYIKKTKDGSITKFWQKENQPTQIAKVAESQGLRTLWPDEFQQLYTAEEMGEPDSFKAAEATVTDKAADLTEKIKGKPEYKATEIKKDAQTGGYMESVKGNLTQEKESSKPTVDPQTGEDLEHDEPEGILPKGTDAVAWMTTCKPRSSVSNAKTVIAVAKEIKGAIDALTDVNLQGKLRNKKHQAEAFLAEIESRKQEIAEDKIPIPEEDKIPAFEKEHEPVDNGRMAYIEAMKGYRELDGYQAILNDNNFKDLNAVPHTKVDQDYILGRMAEKFGG